ATADDLAQLAGDAGGGVLGPVAVRVGEGDGVAGAVVVDRALGALEVGRGAPAVLVVGLAQPVSAVLGLPPAARRVAGEAAPLLREEAAGVGLAGAHEHHRAHAGGLQDRVHL